MNPNVLRGLGRGLQLGGAAAQFIPGIGTVAGAGMSLAGAGLNAGAGYLENKQLEEEYERIREEEKKRFKNIYDKQVLDINPTTGVESPFFAYGGWLNQYNFGGVPPVENGYSASLPNDNAMQLSSDSQLAVGNPMGHNTPGGDVPIMDGNGVAGTMENNEVLYGDKVLSDRTGHAEIAKNIASAKGKLEELLQNVNLQNIDAYQKNSISRTMQPIEEALSLLDTAMQTTFQQQEMMKQQMMGGQQQQPDMMQQQNMQNEIPQYYNGGDINDPTNPYGINYNTLIKYGKQQPNLTGYNSLGIPDAPTGISAGYKTSGGSGLPDTQATNYDATSAKQGIANWYKQNEGLDLTDDDLDLYYNYHFKKGSPSSIGAMQLAYTGTPANNITNNTTTQYPPFNNTSTVQTGGWNEDWVKGIGDNSTTTNVLEDVVTPETPTINSMGMGLKNKYNAADLVPFADNVANFFINRNMPAIPRPLLEQPVALDTTYNIEPQLQNIRNEVGAFNTDVDNTMSNANTATANKLAAMTSGVDSQNTLWGEKENAETDLRNKHAANVQDVQMRNVGELRDYDLNNMFRKIKQQENLSANVSNAVDDFGQIRLDKKQENLDNQERMLMALQYMDTGVAEEMFRLGYFDDTSPEFQKMLQERFKTLKRQ